MSSFLGHTSHDKCGSSDALALYEDDDGTVTGWCFSCSTFVPNPEGKPTEENKRRNIVKPSVEEVKKYPTEALTTRHISKEVAEIYGVRVSYSPTDGSEEHYWFPVHRHGDLCGFKSRWLKAEEKKERYDAIGDIKNSDLFGQHLCGNGGKMIVVTEGELDALSAFQMFRNHGKTYRVVSLPSGANKGSFQRHLEWLNSFDKVKLCLDQDEQGKKLAKEAANLFPAGKVEIMSFNEKDANEMLLAGKEKEFLAALWNAKSIHLDGIVSGKDTWEHIQNKPRVVSLPYPEDWVELNLKTYGMRLGELDTWTSGSGSGKTQVLRELQYHVLTSTEDNVGVLSLEEPLTDSVEALMSLHLNKRIHLPDIRSTIPEHKLYEAWKATAGTNRIHFYDHFGSLDDESLIAKIRYLAKGLDCKWIFLDHLSIVVSEFAAEGGERERIDTAMSRLKKLTQELNIWIGLVVHLRKRDNSGKSFEEGAVPSLDDLRGSGSIKQLSNGVYTIARNQQEPNDVLRNTSSVYVLKCRFTGDTGRADYLYFDRDTGRMTPIDNPYGGEEKQNVA